MARVVYYCGVCRTASEPGDGYDALQARQKHRTAVHHGQTPDGEEVRPYEEPGQSGGLLGCLAMFAGFLLLAAYGWIKRHI